MSNVVNVKIYVNDVESIRNTTLTAEAFTSLGIGRYGRGYTDRYTDIEMDELCIWDRPLSIDEIREWRHLTKTDATHSISSGLIAYYRFNENSGNISINKTNNTWGTKNG